MRARPAIRLRRWLVALAVVLLVTIGSAVALLRIRFEGPDLAEMLCTMLNSKMRGEVHVRSIEWPVSGMKTMVTGGWVPLTFHDIEIKDYERETVLLSPKITAEIDIHALLFGNHDLVFRKIVVHGGSVLLREVAEPYPLYLYDTKVFSLLAAFYGKRGPASFYAGLASSSAPPLFDLRDFHVEDVDVEVLIKPDSERTSYQFRARVENVSAEGFLYMDASDPVLPKFYFSLAPEGGPGEIDLFWEQAKDRSRWSGLYRFPLTAMRAERVSQLPASWPASPVATSLNFQLEVDLKSAAKASLKGSMVEYMTSPYGGDWDIRANVTNAGAMLSDAFIPELGGDDVTINTKVTGSIVFFPRIDLAISGLTYDLEVLERNLHLELETLHAVYDLQVNTGTVEEFIGRGAGGMLKLSASFEGDGSDEAPFLVDSNIAITDPLELSEWLTPCLRGLIGDRLSGNLRARRYKGDTKLIAHVDDFVFDFGILKLSAKASVPGGGLEGISADQLESVLNFKDVQADLGTAHTTINGFYNWDTNRRKIKFKGGATRAVQLATRVQTCLSELGDPPTPTAPPRPKLRAKPRRGGGPMRRTGARYLRPSVAAISSAPESRGVSRPRPTLQAQAARPRTRRCSDINLDDTETEWSSDGGDDSKFSGSANLSCLPVIGSAHVVYRTDGKTATIQSATTKILGGLVRASGVVRLKPSLWVERLRVIADNVDLARVSELGGLVVGKVAADVTVRGPLDPRRMTGEGWACANQVTILGDVYTDVGLWLSRAPTTLAKCKGALPPDGSSDACLAVGKAGGRCLIARARRDAGGEIAMRVHADRNQRLGGTIAITGVPLQAIAALTGATIPAGATLDASGISLGGTLDAPTASGTVRVTRGWVLDTFVGDGDVTVRESGPGAIELAGSFLDGRLTLRGRLTTAAPYQLDLTVEASRLALDAVVDLAKLTGLPSVHALASGRVRVRTALGDPKAPLDVTLELSELSTTVAVPGMGDTSVPIDVKLARPVLATYDGTTLAITDKAAFATPFGTIEIEGQAAPGAVELRAVGALDLSRARALTGNVLDDIRGTAEVEATINGRVDDPRIKVTIDLADAAVRLPRQEAVLRIPAGRIGIEDGEVSFTGLALEVTDGYSDEAKASLSITGGLVLEDWKPTVWNVVIAGDLAGEMLVALAPSQIASATGVADITVRLAGPSKGGFPPVDVLVELDPTRPLTMLLRSVRREVALTSGTITVTNDRIELEDIGGSLDGEGRLRGIRGIVDLEDWKIKGADITGSADAVPYRVPRELDLVVNIDRMNGVLNDRHELEVSGNVEIVSGRYLRDFNLGDAFVPTSSVPSPPPFWESEPIIANAALDIKLEARRFSVVDNIANIDMFGTLQLKGTPNDPRIDGTISVQRGQFRIPGLRARFSRTTGTVTFSPRLPPSELTLDLASEADYRDPTGQDHLITLIVKGSLKQPDWDLFTASGLNKAQTLTLIISGRTPEEFRRNLGQGAIGSDPSRIAPSTDTSQGYTDELFRQAAGDLLTRAVADTLRDLSGLDVARIEFNLGAFGFHGEKRVFENAQLVGDLERTTRGSTVNARAELQLPFSFTAELSWLVKNFDDAAEKDINDIEVKTVWRTFCRRWCLGD